MVNAVHLEGRKEDFPQGLGQHTFKLGLIYTPKLSGHSWDLSRLGDRSMAKPGIWSRGEPSSYHMAGKGPQPIFLSLLLPQFILLPPLSVEVSS